MKPSTTRLAAAGIALALVAAACGGSSDDSGTTAAGSGAVSATAEKDTAASDGATGDGTAAAGDTAKGASDGKLQVTTFAAVPPLAFFDDDGKASGWLSDLENEAASRMGVEIEFLDIAFENVIPGVQSGRYDIGSGVDATAEREEVVDIVTMAAAGYTFLALTEGPDVGSEMSDLCGYSVGVVKGQSTIPALEEASSACSDGEIDIQTFADASALQLAIQSKRTDLMVTWEGIGPWTVKQDPTLKVTGPTFNKIETGVAVAKGNPLGQQLADTINEMIADGSYQKIMEKWESGTMVIDKSVINPVSS